MLDFFGFFKNLYFGTGIRDHSSRFQSKNPLSYYGRGSLYLIVYTTSTNWLETNDIVIIPQKDIRFSVALSGTFYLLQKKQHFTTLYYLFKLFIYESNDSS